MTDTREDDAGVDGQSDSMLSMIIDRTQDSVDPELISTKTAKSAANLLRENGDLTAEEILSALNQPTTGQEVEDETGEA